MQHAERTVALADYLWQPASPVNQVWYRMQYELCIYLCVQYRIMKSEATVTLSSFINEPFYDFSYLEMAQRLRATTKKRDFWN
jgi:hypothetical protein